MTGIRSVWFISVIVWSIGNIIKWWKQNKLILKWKLKTVFSLYADKFKKGQAGTFAKLRGRHYMQFGKHWPKWRTHVWRFWGGGGKWAEEIFGPNIQKVGQGARTLGNGMLIGARGGHVEGMGGMKNSYKILVGKFEGKRPLGRLRHRWECNMRLGLCKYKQTAIGCLSLQD
jgi:hypothetical protein